MITEESMPAVDASSLVMSRAGQALVRSEARRLSRYLGSGLDEEDLLQAGQIGLLLAADRYDPQRGTFCTYARWWVLSEMAKVIHHSRSPMRLPTSVRERLRQCEALISPCGECPSADALAAKLKVSVEHARTLHDIINGTGEVLYDTELLQDPSAIDEDTVLTRLDDQRHRAVLRQHTTRLPRRDRRILTGLYGLDGKPRRTMRELGEQLGISHQRVQQLRDQALHTLRLALPQEHASRR